MTSLAGEMTPGVLKEGHHLSIGERITHVFGRVISRCFFGIFGLPE